MKQINLKNVTGVLILGVWRKVVAVTNHPHRLIVAMPEGTRLDLNVAFKCQARCAVRGHDYWSVYAGAFPLQRKAVAA